MAAVLPSFLRLRLGSGLLVQPAKLGGWKAPAIVARYEEIELALVKALRQALDLGDFYRSRFDKHLRNLWSWGGPRALALKGNHRQSREFLDICGRPNPEPVSDSTSLYPL
ncbi:MAG: hypothetical protein WDN46_03215 [Methylocella sp.]